MITKENLLFSTFIGLPVEIANSSQRAYIGLKGTVVDETKNLIVIEVGSSEPNIPGAKSDAGSLGSSGSGPGGASMQKEVKIPKASSVFRFTLDDGTKMDVDGREISFRPHERAKKV